MTVAIESECVEWTGATARGYGCAWWDGKKQLVHRVTYRLYYGLTEAQMPPVVRHTCDNPSCYNIEHLVGGTQQDNIRDAIERGRHRGRHANAAKTHCPHGHPYSGENLHMYKSGRYCRECKRLRNLKRNRRKTK